MYDCVSYTYHVYPNIKWEFYSHWSYVWKKMEGHLIIKCEVKHKDSGLLGCDAALIGKWFHEPWTLEDEGDIFFKCQERPTQ
jgi:hypothetical protein